VSCMLTPKFVICVNAGDSRAVIGTGASTVPLSEDHKPQDDIERMRIEKAGGTIQWKRVDGDLAVSRAFGDFQYKTRPDLPPEEQKVSCEPDVRVHKRTLKDDILLVACDGLWDVFSNSDAIEFAREILLLGETDPVKLAEEVS
jgi:serine/threonine protein phosphatase PrpC